jgi:cytoskeletal protein RodZ
MDDKRITLVASLISLAAIAVVVAAFFWDASSSTRYSETAMENKVTSQQEDATGKTSPKESTSAIITDVEHTQSPPKTKASGGDKPENIVHLSLPDQNDTTSDRSAERFESDADEEDTDDGIVIETEPDDE